MATLTYLANSAAFFIGGVGLGYFLHDIRNAIKNREINIVVNTHKDDEEEDEDANKAE